MRNNIFMVPSLWFKANKEYIFFLARFLFTYLGLSFIYAQYLSSFNELDGITKLTVLLVDWIYQLLNLDFSHEFNPIGTGEIFYYDSQGIFTIIEGCNGFSVFITYLSFLFAFRRAIHHYLKYLSIGVISILFVNILRIAVLGYLLLSFPHFGHIAHQTIFPAVIYGIVILLWFLWIRESRLDKKKDV